MTFMKTDDIYIKLDDIFKAQDTFIACIFRKQNMFLKLQLLMSLSMNQFIQRFAI